MVSIYSKTVGYKINGLHLLGTCNVKTIKSQAKMYNTGILYLAPGYMLGKQSQISKVLKYDKGLKQGKKVSLCPAASIACLKTCLFISGARIMFKKTIPAAFRKAKLLFSDYDQFFALLVSDLAKIVRLSEKHSMVPCIRLNGTSDIAWERLRFEKYQSIMERFPTLQFYDYTKRYNRMLAFCKGDFPPNYYLTFSRSGDNDLQCQRILKRGKNVSVVFRYPFDNVKAYLDYPLISGEIDDTRFLDTKPRVVGLLAKARAKHNTSGFVVWNKKGE